MISGRYAVSTSLAFGGNNAAIVIGREDGSMKIAGIGMIFSRGLGIGALRERACFAAGRSPGNATAHWLPGGKAPAYLVDFNSVP